MIHITETIELESVDMAKGADARIIEVQAYLPTKDPNG